MNDNQYFYRLGIPSEPPDHQDAKQEALSNCDSFTFEPEDQDKKSVQKQIMNWFQAHGIKQADPASIVEEVQEHRKQNIHKSTNFLKLDTSSRMPRCITNSHLLVRRKGSSNNNSEKES